MDADVIQVEIQGFSEGIHTAGCIGEWEGGDFSFMIVQWAKKVKVYTLWEGGDFSFMIVQWAKKVPGFKKINMQDQMSLLKACFMDLNVLRLA